MDTFWLLSLKFAFLEAEMTIVIAESARVSMLADIEKSLRGTRIVVGAHSVIDSFVKIKAAGGIGDLYIGEHVVINTGCVLYTGGGISIGNHVAVAANCTFAPVNHAYKDKSHPICEQGFWPGKGTILRRGCVLGAGSAVRSELAAYTVYAGQPLRVVGERQ